MTADGKGFFAAIPRFASRKRVVLSSIASVLFLVFADPDGRALLWGSLPVILGEGIRIWSSGHIDKNDRITREGPYSLSRNPLYIGNFLIGTGFVVAARNAWIAAAFLVFFTAIYAYTIRYEEAFLKTRFPTEYGNYERSVPRWISLGRLGSYVPGRFRWRLVTSHREWGNMIVILIGYSILVFRSLV